MRLSLRGVEEGAKYLALENDLKTCVSCKLLPYNHFARIYRSIFLPSMSIVIAVPSHPIFEPLLTNAEDVCKSIGARLLRGTEQECNTWLARHVADVALVTPFGYARESLKTDLRIVPVNALTLDALTYTGSIYLHKNSFAANARDARCASPAKEDFLMMMGAAVLSEKFDLELTIEKEQGSVSELLRAGYDAVLDYGFDSAEEIALDISDEWSDYFGELLPMAVWACRPEEVPETIGEILSAFRNSDEPVTRDIEEAEHHGTTAQRIGVVSTAWNDEVEEALQRTIELLFYWQFIPSVAATKLWMRDVVERL